MKTSTKIIIGIAGLIGAGALVWYFTQKTTTRNLDEKSKAAEGADSKVSDVVPTTAISDGTSKGGRPSKPSRGSKGGRIAWSPTNITITKISRLKNTPLGQKLGLKSLDAATINNLQAWFDALTPKEKKLLGYVVYIEQQRIESGELPNAIESKEGQGSWNQILTLTNKMKDISQGEQIAAEQAAFAFGGFSD